tara:strand:+ start:361 stop:594 length:234 start_codon:yes stop_codon:yes gene_type:complete
MDSEEVRPNSAEDLNFQDIQESIHSSLQKQKDSTTKFPQMESQAGQTKSSALSDDPSTHPQGDQQVQYWKDSFGRVH